MLSPFHVLLIDDNPDDRALVTRELRREFPGVQVLQVSAAPGLAQALEQGGFDLVITDYQLRWTTGLDILHAIRKSYRDCPVVMFTATGSEEVAVEAMKAGLDDYVLKSPKHLPRLAAAVRMAVLHQQETVARRAAQDALTRERDLVARIMQTSPAGIVVVDRKGQITYANARAEQVLGLTRDEITQRSYDAPAWHHTDYDGKPWPPGEQPFVRVMTTGRPVWDVRQAIEWPDGKRRLLSINAAPLRDETGQVDSMVETVEDVSERVRADEQRQQLEVQLRQAQKMEAMGMLAGGVAHDFNNLLTVIMGHAQLAMTQIMPEHILYQDLAAIEKATQHAAILTRQLLALSRRQVLEFKPLSLDDLVKDFAKMLGRVIGEHIVLRLDLADESMPVRGDANALEQVLMNLALNARDAMQCGGTLRIATRLVDMDLDYYHLHPESKPGQHICLSVSDTGVGMSAATLARLFEPFFTTKEVGKGTGLGLAVVYGIVRQHDGWLDVQSQVEVGTTFNVYLPVHDASVQRVSTPVTTTAPHGSETLLLAEDEESVRDLAHGVLEDLGYHLLVAEDGQRAVELFAANCDHIDMVVMDAVMPRLSGREVYQSMMRLRPDVPVLLVSGYTPEAAQLTAELPANMWLLQKPFALDQLARTVRQVLDEVRQQRQASYQA